MKAPSYTKWLLLIGLLMVFMFLDLWLGSVTIPLKDVIAVLFGQDIENDNWQKIIWLFRLPRVITALLVGSGLAISGLLMQTFFRNPLAGPFVLGISSGASLGVAFLVLAGAVLPWTFLSSTVGVVVAATVGSGLIFMLILIIAQKVRDSTVLLIIGLMFGSLSGAIVGILQYLSSAEELQTYMIWTFGSLGGVAWNELPLMAIIIVPTILVSFFMFKPLNVLLLGETYAISLGLNLKSVRNVILLCTSLLAGGITAFVGPIAFIGIAVPHLTRSLFDTSNHKILLPAVALSGAILMVFCDVLAQLPGSSSVLPINAVTSLIGAPVVIWIIMRKRNLGHFFRS